MVMEICIDLSRDWLIRVKGAELKIRNPGVTHLRVSRKKRKENLCQIGNIIRLRYVRTTDC